MMIDFWYFFEGNTLWSFLDADKAVASAHGNEVIAAKALKVEDREYGHIIYVFMNTSVIPYRVNDGSYRFDRYTEGALIPIRELLGIAK